MELKKFFEKTCNHSFGGGATISSCTKDGLFPDKDGREETVTGNGNTLFLPAAGYAHATSLAPGGDYWTSSLMTSSPDMTII